MKKINYIILLMLTILVASCEPTYKKEYSWAYPVAGDWTVIAYVNGVPDSDPFELKSYNSAFGKDSIWVDDYHGNFWGFQGKAAVNMSTKTFGNADSVVNVVPDYEIGLKIKNGKIIGNDSIYFEIQFQDEEDANHNPTPYATTYQIKGHRTTSYEEYMQQ